VSDDAVQVPPEGQRLAMMSSVIYETFTPSTAVSKLDLFAGRQGEIQRVFGAVFSPGQHAAIYGERGVGKTSLANIIYDVVVATGRDNYIPARVNCSQGITFVEIWQGILKQLPVFKGPDTFHLDDQLPSAPNSEEIRGLLEQIDNPSIIVIDEFDRVEQETATAMADTIKTLSDRASQATLVIVGVADSIDQLIEEHASITRALVQIHMPRMSPPELTEIISNGLARCQMTMEEHIPGRIATLSQGLPHYTHLLAKHAALAAVRFGKAKIDDEHYQLAVKEAVADKQQTLGKDYRKATYSPKKNIFPQVLLACALAADKDGYFSAKDVRGPLRDITKETYEIQAYIRHLDKFSQDARGPVLRKEGTVRNFRYKFVEPLMQPYVVMKGLSENLITEEQLHP
jgi:Cdc6-like AAA superfamily ATPase